MVYNMTSLPRLIVDPNSFSRVNSEWTTVGFEHASRVPNVGDRVIAVQDDPGGHNLVARGVVRLLDPEYELIYVDVEWDSFVDEGLASSRHVTSTPVQVSYHFDGAQPGWNSATRVLTA